jgi:hypothetical protein
MPQASFFAFARSLDFDPDGDLLRHSNAAAERQPDAAAVIAIEAIERGINGVEGGVARCHEVTGTPTWPVVLSGTTDLSWRIGRRRQDDGRKGRTTIPRFKAHISLVFQAESLTFSR